jgi:hypothetical protein
VHLLSIGRVIVQQQTRKGTGARQLVNGNGGCFEAALRKDHRKDQLPNDNQHRRDGDKVMLAREAISTDRCEGILMPACTLAFSRIIEIEIEVRGTMLRRPLPLKPAQD